MNLLLTLTHWFWWLVSPNYRWHYRTLGAIPEHELAPESAATLVGGQRVYNVHPVTACIGTACCIHNPSDHHMADWRQNWRDDRKLMERICPHGIGHPDPDHLDHLRRVFHADSAVHLDAVHGCDRCCDPHLAATYGR